MRIDAMTNLAELLVVAAIVALGAAPAPAAEPAGYLRDFRRGHAILDTARGCIYLDIYFADSPEQRRQGLMRIRELGEFESMIFISNPPIVEVMWMQNTYIPLDMIYLRDGKVVGITENAQPLSEDLIRSPGPISAVLEVNGGFAARHRVRALDKFALLD